VSAQLLCDFRYKKGGGVPRSTSPFSFIQY
jgi:hypothetical protein